MDIRNDIDAASPEEAIEVLRARIDELTAQLDEARSANMAKETFLSNMSHDIRTPMNAIVGMTALAKKHIDEKARVADALNKIETASGHLLSLINDVLDMSRIDSGRMQIAEGSFSLSDLLHDLLIIVKPQIDEKGHTFELRLGDIRVESFRGDALRLRQVYVNIINNAVKYTEAGGHIDLQVYEELTQKSVAEDDSRCVLHFICTDNGMGMSEEFLLRIFDPFERANSSTVSKIEGTGLGMSIVKRIVEAMDGRISIRSEQGKGTEVSISIPLRYETDTIDPAGILNKRFLIIEDTDTMIRTYTDYLGEYDIACTIVPTETDALAALTEAEFGGEEYHAVIIGNMAKNSAGAFDVAAYLKKSRPGLPLILISGDDWEKIRYHAHRCGIGSFIPLPVFRRSLIDGLSAALSDNEGREISFGAPDLSGRRILLAEDNPINQEIAKEILSATNAQIDMAENGKEALARFSGSGEGYYSVILMDIQMPVMDGYEAAEKIRSLERQDALSVPILAMTANTFAEDIAKAREAGMNGHIAKPIDITALMSSLRKCIPQ